jgi:replication factor C large subunit
MTSSTEWAEEYRPQSLKEIVGNKRAVQYLRAWADEWLFGIPEKRAVILYGPPGIGKTSSAHALARDQAWEVIELNASDQRTAGVIEKIAGSAAYMDTLFGGKRLIILDEADNIHGSADRGGLRAIAGIIKSTLQPIVLIANDVYGLTPTIRNLCLEIKFGSVQSRSMVSALNKMCESEGISCAPDVALKIAENSGGDFRSAINDLQAAAIGKKVLEANDICTSGRENKKNIFKAMQTIFKSTDCKKALDVTRGLDESPEDLVQWIDENLPIQYSCKDGKIGDIRTGFGYLSRADLYLGRVKKRQNYRMWRYASMLMVCGTAISKTRSYPGFIKFQQPSLWRRLGQIHSKRDIRDNIVSKIGEHSFESMRYSRKNLLNIYSRMVKDEIFSVEIIGCLRLELEEYMYLSGSTKVSRKMQKIYDEAQKFLHEENGEAKKTEFFKTSVSSKNNKQISSCCRVKSQEKKEEKSSGKFDIAEFRVSEDEQKIVNLGFNVSPKISEEKKPCESNKPDDLIHDSFIAENPEYLEKNVFSRSEPVDDKISTEPSRHENSAKKEPFLEEVTELKSVNFDTEAREIPKKLESKSQKTLFDF